MTLLIMLCLHDSFDLLSLFFSFTLSFSSFAIFLLLIMLSDESYFNNLARSQIFRNDLERQRNLQLYAT